MTNFYSIPIFLVLVSSFLLTNAQYAVVNNASGTPGGSRFDSKIGQAYTLGIMKTINYFIWNVFHQHDASTRKQVPVVTVYITALPDGALGEIGGDNVYIDAGGIHDFAPGRAKYEFTSVMYHEMTHIFQWSGKGTAPGGLTEGVADYVRIKANYYDPNTYTKPGSGSRWDEGYGVTARFLEYCDSLRPGFTAALNNMMRYVYKDEYFNVLLKKPLDQVWREYKNKYGNIP